MLAPGKPYSGRRPTAGVLNLTLDRDVIEKIRLYSGSQKKMGAFVAKCVGLFEIDQARRSERQRIIDLLSADGQGDA